MMLRTHAAISAFAILLFLPHITGKILFIIVGLIATFLPDADTGFSSVGKNPLFRPMQILTRHRGILHSFTFLIAISALIAVVFPKIALAFFLGYSLHIFADSFTPEGVRPFWPSKRTSSWKLKTGGTIENGIFVFFIFADLVLFFVGYLI